MTGVKLAAKVLRALSWGCAVALVSGAAFAVTPDPEANPKPTDCLTSPKAQTPPGERWYYRVERGTKRHCWYTRAGATSNVASQRTRPSAPSKQAAELPASASEPLQLSVANARAEASMTPRIPAAEQSAPQLAEETRNPAWTMADRWSQEGGEPAPAPTKTSAVRAAAPPANALSTVRRTEPETTTHDVPDDSLIGISAAVVALLGLSTVLVATLMRRRRRRWVDADREPSRIAPVTDLNDRPLMTWRKGLRDQLRNVHADDPSSVPQPALNPIDREAPPRRRTAPPGVRA